MSNETQKKYKVIALSAYLEMNKTVHDLNDILTADMFLPGEDIRLVKEGFIEPIN